MIQHPSFSKVAFRFDSSTWIGSGHAVRCSTLGRALLRQGVEVHILTREMPGHSIESLKGQGFLVHPLPKISQPLESNCELPHGTWLGVDQETDLTQCSKKLSSLGRFDWLITDHYALDHRWQKPIRQFTKRILAIDDVADRKLEADILLDQNYFKNPSERYLGLVPEDCLLLLGPSFALLKEDFQQLTSQISHRDGKIRRIFVFFGGFDEPSLTARWVDAFISLPQQDVVADVVINKKHPSFSKLKIISQADPRLKLHSDLPSLGPLMLKADLAFGGGGTTTWERCCLGLPSIVISLAENQISIAKALSQANILGYLGHHDQLNEKSMQYHLSQLIKNGPDPNWAEASRFLVDGKGTLRTAETMSEIF
jgi:UDP-2,4-diacetamido-2,4,6-trideoxy-beta-L-altropyranose hydrolase